MLSLESFLSWPSWRRKTPHLSSSLISRTPVAGPTTAYRGSLDCRVLSTHCLGMSLSYMEALECSRRLIYFLDTMQLAISPKNCPMLAAMFLLL